MIRSLTLAATCLALAACGPTPSAPDTRATPKPSPTPSATPTPAPPLVRFVGQYPFDRVDGQRFLDAPAVRRQVETLAPDPDVARTVLAGEGPSTPIVEQADRLLSWGCEAHNCGSHNWALSITPDGKTAALCYKPDDADARWYGDKPEGTDATTCPSGDDAAN